MSDDVRLSKAMSTALRHRPSSYGLALDVAGWTTIAALVDGLRSRGIDATEARVRAVVVEAVKQRHEIDGDRIRARYGHSLPGTVELEVATPPPVLFHGTTAMAAARIDVEGLRPMKRQFVHLSPHRETAERVGSRRRGDLVVYEIDAVAALAAGVVFRRGNDDTWLVAALSPSVLRRIALGEVLREVD